MKRAAAAPQRLSKGCLSKCSKRKAGDCAAVVQADGMFRGVHVVLIPGGGVLEKQLQIWCRKVTALGGGCETLSSTPTAVTLFHATHVIAATTARLEQRMAPVRLVGDAEHAVAVSFKWLEGCLGTGALVRLDEFLLRERNWYVIDRKAAEAGGACQMSRLSRLPIEMDGDSKGGVEKRVIETSLAGPLLLTDRKELSGVIGAGPIGQPVDLSPSPVRVRVPPAGSLCCVSPLSASSDDVAGPLVRDTLQSLRQGGVSRIARMQEWMKEEMARRRRTQPQDTSGGESQVASMASQECEGEEEGDEGEDVPLGLNKHITQHFVELKNIYEALGDEWRSLTYRRAIATLERVPFRVSASEQLAGVAGVGQQVRDKVKEILGTGQLSKLESFKSDTKLRVLRLFSSVFGIGAKTALELYARGHRTLADLGADASLSRQAKLGLHFHDDINAKMTREDIQRIHHLVKAEAEAVCPGVWCEVTGSYRRGREECGDVDFLVTHPDGKSHRGLLPRLHQRLTSIGFLTADLRSFEDAAESGEGQCQTYLGMCRPPGMTAHRRIDIKVYPVSVYSTALVHFTGNDVFNRKVRYFALQLGFKLSEYGLFPVTTIGKRKFVDKTSVQCATEKDVFANLGLEYLEPHERNW